VSRHGRGGEGVLVPADERLADDLVGSDVDDGNVGNTVVRSADLNLHGDDLSGGVLEDLASIGEWHTLALPRAAVGVVTLSEVLKSTLDVSVVVGALGVVELVTTGSLEAITGHTRSGLADEAVGGDGGGKASNGGGDSVGLHCDCCWVV